MLANFQKEKFKLSKDSYFSSYSKKNLAWLYGIYIIFTLNFCYCKISNFNKLQESMRLLVAEKLYSLCSTTEYRDMPINEINKCIDKVS